MNKEQQELMYKLSIFEQQIQQVQQQLKIVEESMVDLNSLSLGLDEIKDSEGKEMLAPLGRGIFVKAKLISKDLTVDIGGKTFVKKTVPEAKNLIEQQAEKLEKIRDDLMKNMEQLDKELTMTIREAQRSQGQ